MTYLLNLLDNGLGVLKETLGPFPPMEREKLVALATKLTIGGMREAFRDLEEAGADPGEALNALGHCEVRIYAVTEDVLDAVWNTEAADLWSQLEFAGFPPLVEMRAVRPEVLDDGYNPDPRCSCDHPAADHHPVTGGCLNVNPGIGPCPCTATPEAQRKALWATFHAAGPISRPTASDSQEDS